MSDVQSVPQQSALNGVAFDGLVRVEELGLQGMITLRGDLSDAKFAKAVKKISGADIPAPNSIAGGKDAQLAWMSPDELLLLCAHDRAEAVVAELSKALAGSHFMAVNVSDARAFFALTGAHTREVLAKLCPADMSPDAFAQGAFRRTRMAQVPAAVWMEGDDRARVVCFRSAGQYVFDLLSVAAQPGSDVGYFRD